jgi:hypothetical protein
MAEHIAPADLNQPAATANRPLLSALTRWWSPAESSAVDAVLGYESAQPWMLDDTPSDAASHLHY